jgi:mRNA interferase RelE/StbE
MKRTYKVIISEQVENFLRTLPPVPKHTAREAMAKLAFQQGNITALENELVGYHRLRVGRYRVIFVYAPGMTIDCLFMEGRKLVYEIFAALLKEQIIPEKIKTPERKLKHPKKN